MSLLVTLIWSAQLEERLKNRVKFLCPAKALVGKMITDTNRRKNKEM